MNTKPIVNISWFTILALVVAFIAGCATTKPIDWNSRVGSYTFDQAVTELGPPDKQAALSDGKIVASMDYAPLRRHQLQRRHRILRRQYRLWCRPNRRDGLPATGC